MRIDSGPDTGRTWGPEAFVGGHLALDFTNTVGWSNQERTERLNTYADLLAWARAAEVVDGAEAATLGALAEGSPDAAAQALRATQAEREALHRWLATVAAGEHGDDTDRVRVVDSLVRAYRSARLTNDPGRGPALSIPIDDAGLALPARRVALSTSVLLNSSDLGRVSLCGRCSWLFLDTSPSRRRRWCSMATCGNRAKAERHYSRHSRR